MLRLRFYLLIVFIFILIFPTQSFAQKLTLERAIEEAVTRNPDLLKAEQEVGAAKAGFWEGVSPEYPEFFIEYEGIPEKSHSLSDYEEKKFGLTQGLDFPLAYFFKGQWHHFEKKRMEAEFLLLCNNLVSEVKKGFYRVILLDRQTELYEEIARITRQNFQKARVRVLAGESSPYDTLKVKVDLAEVENRVLVMKRVLEVARSELGLFLGRERGEPVDVVGDLSFLPVSLNQDSLCELALANHPSLMKAWAEVGQKSAKRRLSWTGLMPGIHLRYFRQEFPSEPSPRAWGGEIGVSVPLWFFLKGQGMIRSASSELKAARWRVESERREVLLEVDQAFSRLIVAEKQVQNYRENTLREVEELVRIATRSYEEGEMGYLEVAEAMRSLNRIQVGYAETLFEYLAAQADLEQAVGVSVSDS